MKDKSTLQEAKEWFDKKDFYDQWNLINRHFYGRDIPVTENHILEIYISEHPETPIDYQNSANMIETSSRSQENNKGIAVEEEKKTPTKIDEAFYSMQQISPLFDALGQISKGCFLSKSKYKQPLTLDDTRELAEKSLEKFNENQKLKTQSASNQKIKELEEANEKLKYIAEWAIKHLEDESRPIWKDSAIEKCENYFVTIKNIREEFTSLNKH